MIYVLYKIKFKYQKKFFYIVENILRKKLSFSIINNKSNLNFKNLVIK